MEKIFHTVITSRRHRELGTCEKSDFGTLKLFELSADEKSLIVSFEDYGTKKEFIEHNGFAYSKLNSKSNLSFSREEDNKWLNKQGKFSKQSAIELMLKIRKKEECLFSCVRNSIEYILIGKTLYARYCKISDLGVTICGNIIFSHWLSIDIEYHINKVSHELSKNNFNKIVKEQYEIWNDSKSVAKNGDGHSSFSKPEKVKWGKNYLV